MKAPYIFNIQKFSLHDGPGIRTTVFFKGCPLRCLWCHNPESQRFEPEPMLDKDGKEEMVGRQYAIPELVKILQADQIFYDQSGGGVTLSGGEVMAQDMDYIEALAQALARQGLSLAVDTCGYAPTAHFTRIRPYTDLFLYDLKSLDAQKHLAYTGEDNGIILENLRHLSEQGAAIDLRLPLIEEENADDEAMKSIAAWLKENDIRLRRISLLAYHDFGRDKYGKLGRACTQNFKKLAEGRIQSIQAYFEAKGYATNVGG